MSQPQNSPRNRKSPRLDEARRVVENAGVDGATWRDVASTLQVHHGSASGFLSRLNATGEVVRLRESRGGRSSIYVLAKYATDPLDVAPRRKSKPGPGYTEGYDAGVVKGTEQGIEEGHAKGWIDGYDAGVAAGRVSALAEAKSRVAAPIHANANATVVVGAMLAAVDPNNATITHRGDCWKQHPACALRAVRRALV